MTGYTGHRRGSEAQDNYIPPKLVDDATLGYTAWYNGKIVHASVGRTSHAKTETFRKMEEMKYMSSSDLFTDSFHSNLTGFTSRGGSPDSRKKTPNGGGSGGGMSGNDGAFLSSAELEDQDDFTEHLDEVMDSQFHTHDEQEQNKQSQQNSPQQRPTFIPSANAKAVKAMHASQQRSVLSRQGSRGASRNSLQPTSPTSRGAPHSPTGVATMFPESFSPQKISAATSHGFSSSPSKMDSRASSPSNKSSRHSRGIVGYAGFEPKETLEQLYQEMDRRRVQPVLGYNGYYKGKREGRIQTTSQHPKSFAVQMREQVIKQRAMDAAAYHSSTAVARASTAVSRPTSAAASSAAADTNGNAQTEFGDSMYYHKDRTFRAQHTSTVA